MVEYICDICNKNFKQKGHYESHKSRKNPCKKAPIENKFITTIEEIVEKKIHEVLSKRNIKTRLNLFRMMFHNFFPKFDLIRPKGSCFRV